MCYALCCLTFTTTTLEPTTVGQCKALDDCRMISYEGARNELAKVHWRPSTPSCRLPAGNGHHYCSGHFAEVESGAVAQHFRVRRRAVLQKATISVRTCKMMSELNVSGFSESLTWYLMSSALHRINLHRITEIDFIQEIRKLEDISDITEKSTSENLRSRSKSGSARSW